jgi:hypothetical protein
MVVTCCVLTQIATIIYSLTSVEYRGEMTNFLSPIAIRLSGTPDGEQPEEAGTEPKPNQNRTKTEPNRTKPNQRGVKSYF